MTTLSSQELEARLRALPWGFVEETAAHVELAAEQPDAVVKLVDVCRIAEAVQAAVLAGVQTSGSRHRAAG